MEKLKVGRKLFVTFHDFFKHAEIDSRGIEVYIKKYTDKNDYFNEYYDELNKITLEEFLQAVYCGYELQETKEELLLKEFNNTKEKISSLNSFRKGVLKTLEILEIKINGIND